MMSMAYALVLFVGSNRYSTPMTVIPMRDQAACQQAERTARAAFAEVRQVITVCVPTRLRPESDGSTPK